MHIPVLKKEVIDYLAPNEGQTIVDATFGEGGHATAILQKLGPAAPSQGNHGKSETTLGGQLIGIDRDPTATAAATEKFTKDIERGRLLLVQGRFSDLATILEHLGHPKVDGVLMDFGVSTQQILSKTRGFSFTYDAPLDMRMDPSEDLSAERILAEWSEHELRSLFFLVGERQYAKKLAQKIVAQRPQGSSRSGTPEQTRLKTTFQLRDLVQQVVPPQKKRGAVNVATRVFMALRIAVNHELEQIEAGLEAARRVINPGGHLVVISFHSLEDKLVKQTFRKWAAPCVCPPELPVCVCARKPYVNILTRKPVQASQKEVGSNPRSRSAKLRACEIL